MSGWRKRSEGPSTSMSRASTAGVDRRCRDAGGSHDLRRPRRDRRARRSAGAIACPCGRSSARAANSRSRRALSGRTSRSPSPDAVSSRIVAESSASARGFPAASRRIRSRTDGASSGASLDTMSRASRSLNGCRASSSMPAASNGDASPSRSPTTITSGSEPRRRATKASASADGRSSHWTSSATTRIGVRAAASASSVSVARAMRNGSSAAPSTRPNATPSAAYCGFGSASRPPRIGRSSWWRPANGRFASVLTPVVRRTRIPAAWASTTARSSSADLPIPAVAVDQERPAAGRRRRRRGRRRSPAPGPGRGSLRWRSPAHVRAPGNVHHRAVRHGHAIIPPAPAVESSGSRARRGSSEAREGHMLRRPGVSCARRAGSARRSLPPLPATPGTRSPRRSPPVSPRTRSLAWVSSHAHAWHRSCGRSRGSP